MAMKPRTFRRVVLIGSLVAVVLVVGLGYFVVRPWQTQRKLNAMRIDGVAAYEAGDYTTANTLLTRYLKSAQNPEPGVMLDYARARLKVQTSDGGYIRSAVRAYRNYLNSVPGDVEASGELLPLFNLMGMHVEAKSLAQDLRTKYGDDRLDTIRQERIAREGLQEGAEAVEPLLKAAVDHPDAGFADLYFYADWLRARERVQEAQELVDARLDRDPDSLAARLVDYWLSLFDRLGDDPAIVRQVSDELAGIVGLDPQTAQWISEPGEITSVMADFLDQRFNSYGRPDLSLAVRERSAVHQRDAFSASLAARRLFWGRQRDRLMALEVKSEEGEPVPDVVAYQILQARADGDEALADELAKKLATVRLDFRGRAWENYLQALDHMERGEPVEARPLLRKALDMYDREPTFHLEMGKLQAKLGRLSDARDEWLLADYYANGRPVSERRPGEQDLGPVGWIEPIVRLIDEYGRANRLPEAVEYLRELSRVAPNNPFANNLVLQTVASMARSNQLARDVAVSVLSTYEAQTEQYGAEYKRDIAPQIATLYAYTNQPQKASEALRFAVGASPTPAQLAAVLDVDQYFSLGVAAETGVDIDRVAGTTPTAALRHALNLQRDTGGVQAGLGFIERSAAKAPESEAYDWELARTKYLDATGDDRALSAWEAMVKAHPDRVDLMYEAAESEAFSTDLTRIDAMISRILKMTGTVGKLTPSRLRLARASAMVRTVRTRQTRQQALEIVRAVVANEPSNIMARNMLGRLLSMRPSPPFTPDTSFEPDYAGAITQYAAIAHLIDGRGAQVYLLEAIDLAIENGDADTAKQYLREFETRFSTDFSTLPEIARRYVNVGSPREAVDIYRRIHRNSTDQTRVADAGLALADLYLTQDNRGQGEALLTDLGQAESLSAGQLARLASLNARYGHKPEGDALAASGERYGLSPAESKLAFALYADAYISEEAYLSALREMIELEPTNAQGWKLLAGRLVQLKRYDEAQEVVERAKSNFPDDSEFKALTALAQGDPSSASEFLSASGVEMTPQTQEAARRVDAYSTLPSTATLDERVKMLRSMLDDFPEFVPLQQFALANLNELPVDPKLVARYAENASRIMPSSATVMRIACEAYLRGDDPQPREAIRLAKLWRANTRGSATEPDAVAARAMIELENYTECVRLLEPHVLGAIEHPERDVSQQVLYAYSHAKLMLGEDPKTTAARLEPLLADHPAIRNRVWLSLGVSSVPSAEGGAAWIRQLEPYAQGQERLAIAGAWVALAERHRAWGPGYAREAIDIIEPTLSADQQPSTSLMVTLSRAYAALARGLDDTQAREHAFARAVSLLQRAGTIEEGNLFLLMQAAAISNESGNDPQTEAIYKQLLEQDLPSGAMKASILNNLAMVMERQHDDPQLLALAHQHAIEATKMADLSSFWGTRGWVELAMGDLAQAESSFRHALGLQANDPEGLVGLVISLHAQGRDDTDEAKQALERVLGLQRAGELAEEYRSRLLSQGAAAWASSLGE